MGVVLQIGIFILFALVVFAIFNLLKIFVLNKITINKWFVLIAAIIAFVLPIVFNVKGYITTSIFSAIFVILLLWFLDLMQYGTKKKEKKIKIKPKAKPNRLKHMNKEKK